MGGHRRRCGFSLLRSEEYYKTTRLDKLGARLCLADGPQPNHGNLLAFFVDKQSDIVRLTWVAVEDRARDLLE
jgi:hypothetical protein